MKRFYKFLSLFLFALIGMTNASAQDYKAGKLLTTPEEVVGKDVVLYSPLVSSAFGNPGYMNGPGKVSPQVSESCIYNFEQVDGEAEGNPIYVLKQKATGLYVKNNGDEGEQDVVYTADKSQAFKMTMLNAEKMSDEENEPKTRTSVFPGKHMDWNDAAFVLTRAEKWAEIQEGNEYCYLGYYGVCFYSPYVDTNVWEIYELAKVQGEELLSNYLQLYQVDATNFPCDKNIPGYFQKAPYEKALAAYEAANRASMGSVSNEEAERLCKELKEAYEALIAARIPISEGYYYINMPKADRTMTTETKVTDGKSEDLLWMKTGFQMPNPIDASAAAYIWKVTPVGKDSFTVQNFYSNQYISNKRSTNYKVPGDNAVAFLVQNESAILGIANKSTTNRSVFIIYANTEAWNTQFHAKHDNHGVMSWNDVENTNNQFVFNPVAQEDIDKIKADVAQQKLNESLSTIYNDALTAYWSGIKVTGAPADEVFTDNGGLAVAYYSESKDTEEGTLEALGDGDFESFFHSNWHSGTFDPSLNKYHYVAVELEEALSKGLSVKLAKRMNMQDYPMQLAIFGANEMAETDADTKWELLGFSDVTWDITNPNVTNADQAAQAIGAAGVTFEGSYKYFKFAATKTDYRIDSHNTSRGYFALSELQVYPGEEDAENSTIKYVSAETRQNMETQLAGAKAELAAKKATQAQIDNLQAAYDKFVEELPVPSLLTDAIAAAKKAKNDAQNAGYIDEDGSKGIGYYSMDVVEALDAAIEAAEAFDPEGKTATEINAEVKKMKDATAAFQNGFTLPEAGKYYTLRGFSNKVNNYTPDQSWQLTSYKAQVRSTGNSLEGGLMMTRPEGANTIEDLKLEGNIVELNEELDGLLNDTIHADENLNYLWYVEKAEAGKLTLRNMGTGMYFAPANGAIAQSTEAAEVTIYLVKPGGFALSLGQNADGAEQYLNALSSDGLTAWGEKSDGNSHWTFKELESELSASTAYWPVAAAQYQILTLPFAVTAPQYGIEQGIAYKVVGVTEENKLVLAAYETDETIEAGVPFIYMGGGAETLYNARFAEFNYANGEITSIDDMNFASEAKEANGLVGQLCGSKKVGAGYAYLNGGRATATSEDGTNIGANSGYIFIPATADKVTEDAGTATIDLGKIVINSIEQNNVVVLPTTVNVYSLNGTLLRKNVKATNATQGLPAGIYVVGNQKVLVK